MDLWDDGSVVSSSITNVNKVDEPKRKNTRNMSTYKTFTASLSLSNDPTNKTWSSNQYQGLDFGWAMHNFQMFTFVKRGWP